MLTSLAKKSAVILLESSAGILSAPSLAAISALSHLQNAALNQTSAIVLSDDKTTNASSFGWNKLTVLPLRTSPEKLAQIVAKNASKSSHVVSAHSALGRAVIPRVAALLDCACVSDVTRIDGDSFHRPIYAGNATTEVKVKSLPACVTIRVSAFPASVPSGHSTEPSEAILPDFDQPESTHISEQLSESARPSLQAASSVISGGRALASESQFNTLLDPLADLLHAAVGASRAAVDAGYATNALQVGQTGVQVAPALYVAIGISGAIQHISGMKDSKFIVAINKDPDAPIFKCADVGLVADLFSAVPELVAELKTVKGVTA